MTPQATTTPTLKDGETLVQSFMADRAVYVRTNTTMAATAMAVGMFLLWAMGNPHIWTGAVGGLAAISIRAFYLMSEELSVRWHLTNQRLIGPAERNIMLADIAKIKRLNSFVQIVTKSGDKHLLKYQADPNATIAALRAQGEQL